MNLINCIWWFVLIVSMIISFCRSVIVIFVLSFYEIKFWGLRLNEIVLLTVLSSAIRCNFFIGHKTEKNIKVDNNSENQCDMIGYLFLVVTKKYSCYQSKQYLIHDYTPILVHVNQSIISKIDFRENRTVC